MYDKTHRIYNIPKRRKNKHFCGEGEGINIKKSDDRRIEEMLY
jgi:hypothetical protein